MKIVKFSPSRLIHIEKNSITPILNLQVTSLPPCWWTITKDSLLASIVRSSNMAATSLSVDSVGIDCKPSIASVQGLLLHRTPPHWKSEKRDAAVNWLRFWKRVFVVKRKINKFASQQQKIWTNLFLVLRIVYRSTFQYIPSTLGISKCFQQKKEP